MVNTTHQNDSSQKELRTVVSYMLGFISALFLIAILQRSGFLKKTVSTNFHRVSVPWVNTKTDSLYYETWLVQDGTIVQITTDSVIYIGVHH